MSMPWAEVLSIFVLREKRWIQPLWGTPPAFLGRWGKAVSQLDRQSAGNCQADCNQRLESLCHVSRNFSAQFP